LVQKFWSALVTCDIGGLDCYLAKRPLDGRKGCTFTEQVTVTSFFQMLKCESADAGFSPSLSFIFIH